MLDVDEAITACRRRKPVQGLEHVAFYGDVLLDRFLHVGAAVERLLEGGVHRDPRRKLVDINVRRDGTGRTCSGTHPFDEAGPYGFVTRECSDLKACTGKDQRPRTADDAAADDGEVFKPASRAAWPWPPPDGSHRVRFPPDSARD